jgi:hypothetical protein
MNWATAIPLVTLLGVVFMSGVAWAKLSSVEKRITEVRDAMEKSAEKQGIRIGSLEDEISVLKHWQAKVEGAEERERDLSGVVRNK